MKLAEQTICKHSKTAYDLYSNLKKYNLITITETKRTTRYDIVASTICKNAKDSIELYNLLHNYKMTNIVKSSTMTTYEDVKVITRMHMVSCEVYRFFHPNHVTEKAYNHYISGWDTYKFYAYDLLNRTFVFKPIYFDATDIHNAYNHFNSMQVYMYHKMNMPTVRQTPIHYTIRKHDNDMPRDIIVGMVNQDYYLDSNDSAQRKNVLKRDKANGTNGAHDLTRPMVSLFLVCFKHAVKADEKARARINAYNKRCNATVARYIKNDNSVYNARIVFGKRDNIKVALYAIIQRQNTKAEVVFFNVQGNIITECTFNYTFKDNKVTLFNMRNIAQNTAKKYGVKRIDNVDYYWSENIANPPQKIKKGTKPKKRNVSK